MTGIERTAAIRRLDDSSSRGVLRTDHALWLRRALVLRLHYRLELV
jgi:hypothetical protein